MKKQALWIWLLLFVGASAVAAQEPSRAALIIRLEDGQTVSRCVEFAEEEINGYDVLARSGLAMETAVAGKGQTVCSIAEQGCPANDCFCQCKGGGDCLYWSYWHVKEGVWQYSQAGAGSYRVHDGAVEGWSWGVGTPNEATEPPLLTFDEVCEEKTESETQNAAEAPQQSISWIGYAVFGIAVLGLGGVLATKRLRD